MLCPVAPFGTRVTPTALIGLAAGADAAAAATTAGWLQRAMPDAPSALLRGTLGTDDLEAGGAASVTVQPHALADHCPALQGPLAVRAPRGEVADGDVATLLGLCEEDDAVVCMTVMRYGGATCCCIHVYRIATCPALPNYPNA